MTVELCKYILIPEHFTTCWNIAYVNMKLRIIAFS